LWLRFHNACHIVAKQIVKVNSEITKLGEIITKCVASLSK
jgi:hypothetical protein